MQYASDAQNMLMEATQCARQLGHSYVGSAHMLLTILRLPKFPGQLLVGAGVDPVRTKNMILVLYGRGTPQLPLPQSFTSHARRILRNAGKEARSLGSRSVDTVHIVLSILRDEECAARELLILNNIDTQAMFTRTVEYLQYNATFPKGKKGVVNTKLLDQFSEDLLEKATIMDPVIGRDREIETVIGILSRKNKNNPALIGEPGVGKTAIAEGLAQRMAAGQVPPQLQNKRLVSLNMANLVAGTK